MCHQTVGLIARQLEAAGVPTASLTSARDITAAANPPRAVFLDYPLGHTSGRVAEHDLNRDIVKAALETFTNDEPGRIVDLAYHWADSDDWKDDVMRVDRTPSGDTVTNDDRVARLDTPQYQDAADAAAARTSHQAESCLVCSGIDY